jgi:hypothetical protein
MAFMNTLKRLMVLGGVGLWLLMGCATPPEALHYQPDNELKPGPGLFTGKAGVYTIYGAPPSVPEDPPAPDFNAETVESDGSSAP